MFGVKSESATSSSLYKIDLTTKSTTLVKKAIGSLLDYNKLSTDPFGKYIAVMTSKTSFILLGNLHQNQTLDVAGYHKVDKFGIDQIIGIRFYGPNSLVVVGENGFMAGFEIHSGVENKQGKVITSSDLKYV